MATKSRNSCAALLQQRKYAHMCIYSIFFSFIIQLRLKLKINFCFRFCFDLNARSLTRSQLYSQQKQYNKPNHTNKDRKWLTMSERKEIFVVFLVDFL